MVPQLMLCFYDQLAPNAVALMAELARIPEVRKGKRMKYCQSIDNILFF